jgi:diguanylate cyclase (GGDEF)-like protein
MADLFRGYFRRDDVICRYGGEEFTIVLPESTAENAATRMAELADRARSLIVLHEGKRLDTVTFSTGIAAFPEHGSSPSALLRSADQALYRSKSDGRDRVTIAMMPGSS